MDDKKSTSGGSFFLGGRLVSWLRKKQDYISWNEEEAKYVTVVNNCNQVVWMKEMLKDIKVEYSKLVVILCDNTSTISISKNLVLHSKTKHIPSQYHMLREKVVEKVIALEYVCTKEKVVDTFTKPLPKETFDYL